MYRPASFGGSILKTVGATANEKNNIIPRLKTGNIVITVNNR